MIFAALARYDHLPIWKDAVALATLLEEAVRRFPRYHKYALGTDLRRQAYAVCRGVVVANGEREGRARAVERLAVTVEKLKLLVQMGKEVKAFASFKEFERAAELAVALSKQSGGWRRSLTGDEADTSPRRPTHWPGSRSPGWAEACTPPYRKDGRRVGCHEGSGGGLSENFGRALVGGL